MAKHIASFGRNTFIPLKTLGQMYYKATQIWGLSCKPPNLQYFVTRALIHSHVLDLKLKTLTTLKLQWAQTKSPSKAHTLQTKDKERGRKHLDNNHTNSAKYHRKKMWLAPTPARMSTLILNSSPKAEWSRTFIPASR